MTWGTDMYEQNSVEFMGVLVDRQYKTGQKYVQLVFETAEGIRLSLSRNANTIHSLKVGLTYKVTGPERTIGQKRYIHEPTATPVSINKLSLFSKRNKLLIPVGISLIVGLSGVGVLAYTTHSTNNDSLSTLSKKKPVSKLVPAATVDNPSSSQPSSNTAPVAPAEQQTETPQIKPIRKSAPTSPITPAANPVVSSPVVTPIADSTTNPPSPQEDTTTPADPPAVVPPGTETSDDTPPPVE